MSFIKAIVTRFRNACRTNDAQILGVSVFTAITCLALLKREGDTSAWYFIVAVAFWSALAFVINLIDPIPKDRNSEHIQK